MLSFSSSRLCCCCGCIIIISGNVHNMNIATYNYAYVRFSDLALELCELSRRQPSVLVVIEALDEVQCAVLGVVEFLA